MERMERLRKKALSLAEQPGVYLMKNKAGQIIYIGKAKRLKFRVVSYFRQNKAHNQKVLQMVSQVEDFDYILCDSEFEALVLECSLIKQHSPKYNILLKDDKGYCYICITQEEYPRVKWVYRKKEDGSRYIGPYTSGYAVKESVETVNKLFGLPTCNRKFPEDFGKQRPCLNFHIHTCAGVCTGKMKKADYLHRVEQAVDYLTQGSSNYQKQLTRQMEEAAEKLDFETAAKLRDQLRMIQRLDQSQKVRLDHDKEQDFIGVRVIETTAQVVVLKFRGGILTDKESFTFPGSYEEKAVLEEFLPRYYHGGKEIPKVIGLPMEIEDHQLLEEYFTSLAGHKITLHQPQRGESRQILEMAQKNALEELTRLLNRNTGETVALQQLQKALRLDKLPDYIESYDISNLGDSSMVAGMVVFEHGRPKRSHYKKFTIKEHLAQDDYGCMSEVVSRRFAHFLNPEEKDEGFATKPDLILLDGGKGHVNTIRPLLASMELGDIPVYGLVKNDKHRTRAIASSNGEVQLNITSPAFRLITKIQDEVHRFSITFQRKTHKSRSFQSRLTQVEGIGPKKAAAVLKAFPTKKELQQASVEQLRQAAKVGEETAQKLYDTVQEM